MSARLTFYGGVDEIGGNKILLETGRTRVFLDFGMSFGARKDFFSDFLQPRKVNGLGDHFRLNLLPKNLRGAYRADYLRHMGVQDGERALDGVLVSHAHVDHIGDLPFLRGDVPILASKGSFAVMAALEAIGGNEYLHWKETFRLGAKRDGGTKKLNAQDIAAQPRPTIEYGANEAQVGDVKARGVIEDHSLPGARGILVEAASTRLAYTGDFRFHGRHGERSRAFVEQAKAFEPDVLLIEGTRADAEGIDSEADVAAALRAEIEATPSLVVAGWPVRDTDRMLSFYDAARAANRKLCISTKQAYVLEKLRAAGETELPSLHDAGLRIYVPRRGWGLLGRAGVDRDLGLSEYREWERPYVEHSNAIFAHEIHDEPDAFVVRVDFFELTQLVDLDPPPGSRYVHSLTEPFDDEGRLDHARVENWLRHFGLFPYVHAHASGHAAGPELWEAIREIAPRTVVPVHTERHDLFEKNLEPLGIRVARPQNAMLPGSRPLEF